MSNLELSVLLEFYVSQGLTLEELSNFSEENFQSLTDSNNDPLTPQLLNTLKTEVSSYQDRKAGKKQRIKKLEEQTRRLRDLLSLPQQVPQVHFSVRLPDNTVIPMDAGQVQTPEALLELLRLPPPGPGKKHAMMHNDQELIERITLLAQGVEPGNELSTGLLSVYSVKSMDKVFEVKMKESSQVVRLKTEVLVAAKLEQNSNFQILYESRPLAEHERLEGFSSAIMFELCQMGGTKQKTPEQAEQAKFSSCFSTLVEQAVPVIPMQVTEQQLLSQGFQKHQIFNPIQLYSCSLLNGSGDDDPKEGSVSLTVQIFSLGKWTRDFDISLTIRDLKNLIERDSHIPADEQQLHFNGQVLENDNTGAYYCFRDGATIGMVYKHSERYFLLPSDLFDPEWDRDYSDYRPGAAGKRGNEVFYPPAGWKRHALKVAGKFENDKWLGMVNGEGEWCVSYHGTSLEGAAGISQMGYDLKRCVNCRYGKGVYSTPLIEETHMYCTTFTTQGHTYQVAFMNRVNPATLKKVVSPNYYVSPSDQDIRPYGLLLKRVS